MTRKACSRVTRTGAILSLCLYLAMITPSRSADSIEGFGLHRQLLNGAVHYNISMFLLEPKLRRKKICLSREFTTRADCE
jgi:hypothetical protein